jgi:LPXTG-motif cell wall-anchored protein
MLVISPTGHIYDILRGYFQTYGYWTVACALLLENVGLPVPGETTLLFGSFLASTEHQLRLPYIIVFGTLAAAAGDNAGYAVGHFGGRRFVENYLHLLQISRARVEQGERFFGQHGALTVYLARFIAGLRIVAGPLAGTLHMQWTEFLLFNFLGAASWVTTIACVGYFFGSQVDRLVRTMSHVNLVIGGLVLLAAALWWWRRRRSRVQTNTGIK